MPLLSSDEACDVADAFLFTLYGDTTFFRWKGLKDKMKFTMERDYVNWLLDVADHYEVGADGNVARSASSTRIKQENKDDSAANSQRSSKRMRTTTATDENNVADHSFSSGDKMAEAAAGEEDAGDSDWDGDAPGVDDEYEDSNEHEHELKDPSLVDAGDSSAVITIPPTSAQLGVEPPPGLAEAADMNNTSGGGVLDASGQALQVRKFPCNQCKYVAKRKDHLMNHVASLHEKSLNPAAGGIKAHPCPKCKFRASRADNLKQHLINKHGEPSKYRCDKCERPFAARSLLESHVKRCRGPVKEEERQKFLCDQCSFTTGHKQSLQRHVHTVHETAEMHACPHCDYVAVRRSNFKQHLICKHQYESVHKCATCNKPFSSRKKLEEHESKCFPRPTQRSALAPAPPDLAAAVAEVAAPGTMDYGAWATIPSIHQMQHM